MSQFNRLQSLIDKKNKPRKGSLLNPKNERKFDSKRLLETLNEIEEDSSSRTKDDNLTSPGRRFPSEEDKGSSSMDTGKGRKKTRKKKGKKRKTRKRRKNRA